MKSSHKKYLIITLIFLVGSLASAIFLAPASATLSKDFHYVAELYSVDNFYDEDEKKFSGEQKSVSTFSYDVESVDGVDGVLLINNNFNV